MIKTLNPAKIVIRVLFLGMIIWLYNTPFSNAGVLFAFGVALAGSAFFLAYNLHRSPSEWLIGWLARLVLILWSFLALSPINYSPIFLMVTLMIFKSLAVISFSSSKLHSITDSIRFIAPVIVVYISCTAAFIWDQDLHTNYQVLYYMQLLCTLFLVILAVEQVMDSSLPRKFSLNNLKNSLFTFVTEYLQILPSASFIFLNEYPITGWNGKYLLIAIMLATALPLDNAVSADTRTNLTGDFSPSQRVPLGQRTSMSIILEWSVWVFPLFILFVGPETSPQSQRILAAGILVAMGVLISRFRRLRIMLQGINLELTRMATFDKLTGILNRVGLNQEWERRCDNKNTMLFIDLDRFKPINDQYGHLVGDEVLITTAKRIKRTIRTTDAVSRVGGDEFVVVCPQLSNEQTELLIKRIRNSIAQPIMLDAALRLQLDASIGYYHSCPTEQFADIINLADSAMYIQKEARKAADAILSDPLSAIKLASNSGSQCEQLLPDAEPNQGTTVQTAGGEHAQET